MTRVSRRSMLAGGAVVAVCGLAGCLAGSRDVERTVTESYTADELSAVAVSTAVGDVDIYATPSGEIEIDGQMAAISRDDLELIGLETSTDDGILKLTVDRDESRSLFGLRPDPILDLSVGVPERLEVRDIVSSEGAINVGDVRGNLNVRTESGDVRLEDIEGPVSAVTDTGAIDVTDPTSVDRLETDTGDVTASLPGIDGDATIATSSGAVELRLPDRLDLTLDITTETGSITVSDVEDLPEMAGDSLIEAVVGDGTHRLEVRTETGDVTVTGRE